MKTAVSTLVLATLLAATSPARAEWLRVTTLPATDVFSLAALGDTVLAGTNTLAYVSTDAGVSWHASAPVTTGTPLVVAIHLRNGRLYAGTAAKGVFVSDDLGATWNAFNQGLVGGLFDSQLHISGFASRGDSLLVSTLGAGVYVRPPGSTWRHFGEEFEPNQASNVNAIAFDGARLLATAGGNGTVFHRDAGDADWTQSFLDNAGLEPGLQAQSLIWNGARWVVGTPTGPFRSAAGEEPWTPVSLGIGPIRWTAFAADGRKLYAAFDITRDVVLATSGDDGASWNVFDQFSLKFVYALANTRGTLFAARADGLFRFADSASTPAAEPAAALRFGLAGRQPTRDDVRFRIVAFEAGPASIELFDVSGRRAADPVRFFVPAGAHEQSWNARALAPGVYLARLTAGGQQRQLRLVHVQ